MFLVGWSIIETNIPDDKYTVGSILESTQPSPTPKSNTKSLQDPLDESQFKTVDWNTYQNIDTEQNEEQK